MAIIITSRSNKSQDSAVGIVISYGLDDRGVRVRDLVGSRILISPCRPNRLWVPPSLSNGYQGPFPLEVNRLDREPDHSPQNSAEVKKTWIYTATPPYAFTE
jgi:hypothetical protein